MVKIESNSTVGVCPRDRRKRLSDTFRSLAALQPCGNRAAKGDARTTYKVVTIAFLNMLNGVNCHRDSRLLSSRALYHTASGLGWQWRVAICLEVFDERQQR